MSTDVAIVGGGPVGLMTAILAREAGLDAVVVEPRTQPVDKACGEGIMPAGLALLRGVGVEPYGSPIAGIRYLDRHRQAEAAFRDGPGLGVRRTTLMTELAGAARARGARVHGGRLIGLAQDDAGVELSLADGTKLGADYLIGADGLHSTVRSILGVGASPPRRPRRTGGTRRHGLRRRFTVTPWTDLVEVYWARHTEAYVTPVGEQEVSVAILSSAAGGFDAALRDFPNLAARLPDGAIPDLSGPVRGAGPFRQRTTRRVVGRALLVGDAAGYVDALTGEGLSVGWRQAAAAVEALGRGCPGQYEDAWRRVVRRSTWLTAGLLHASRVPPIRAAIVPVARAARPVFRSLVDLAARG